MSAYDTFYHIVWYTDNQTGEKIKIARVKIPLQVISNKIELGEIPDKFNRLVIDDMSEVDINSTIKNNDTQYKVDYNLGIIYFGDTRFDGQVKLISFSSLGYFRHKAKYSVLEDEENHFTDKTSEGALKETAQRIDNLINGNAQPSEVQDAHLDSVDGSVSPTLKSRLDKHSSAIKNNTTDIGNKSNLKTNDKNDLVSAINENSDSIQENNIKIGDLSGLNNDNIGDELRSVNGSLNEKAEKVDLRVQSSRIDNLVATSSGSFYEKTTNGTTGALLVVASGATTGQINLASVTPTATGYTPIVNDYVRLVYGVASGSAELIDTRANNSGGVYPTTGNHIRAIEQGIVNGTINLFTGLTWEVGTFDNAGTNVTDTNVIRLTAFTSIPVSKFKVTVPSGYSYAYVEKNASGNPVSGTGATWYTTSGDVTTTGTTIRIKLKKNVGTAADLSWANLFTFYTDLTNQELLDARTDSNGKAYAKVGDAIRSIGTGTAFNDAVKVENVGIGKLGIANLTGSFKDTLSDFSCFVTTWGKLTNYAGYIDANFAFQTHASYYILDPIPCAYGDEFNVTQYIYGNLISGAIYYDANLNIIGVSGGCGNSTWNPQIFNYKISNPNCKYVAFQTGVSYTNNTIIRKRITTKHTISEAKQRNGYIHFKGNVRSTTYTDRAQVRFTYQLPAGANINEFSFDVEKISNISSISYRIFAGLSITTYEVLISQALGFVGENAYSHLNFGGKLVMPSSGGNPCTYLQIFVDLIATDTSSLLEANIPIFKVNGNKPVAVVVHSGRSTDQLWNVPAYAEKSPLYQKTMIGLGDSLMYGNQIGNEKTWLNKLARKYDMTVYNYGLNGNTIAYQSTETTNPPMSVRYSSMVNSADYVVVIGGANDKRLSVPIGTNSDSNNTTFKGALNVLIQGLTQKYPKAKILFMTNYNRYPDLNTLGLSDIDYVQAMQDICNIYAIPCFDNYHNSGISFQNNNQLTWIDEGLVLSQSANHHFSDEAYTWLLPKYEKVVEAL